MSNQSGTQAVDRAARLLCGGRALGRPDDVHRAESRPPGWPSRTTSRLLLALERNRLVRAGRPRPVPARRDVRQLRLAGRRRDTAWSRWPSPSSSRLGKATGETINLGVAARQRLVEQIAQVDSTYLIGGTNWIGLSVPLRTAGAGQGAAGLRRAQLRQLPGAAESGRTDKTITSEAALRTDLATVRDPRLRGDRTRELEPGLIAVAAPVPRLSTAPWSRRCRYQARPPRMNRDGLHRHGRLLRRGGRRPVRGPRLPAAGARQASQGRLTTGRRYAMTTELLGQLYDETLIGNAPGGARAHQRGLAPGPQSGDAAVRRADPVAGGGRRPVRARRLLRARDAHRRARR